MKRVSAFIGAAAVALLAGGFAAQAADIKAMSAAEVSAAFGKDGMVCDWKAGKKGRDKGTDTFHKGGKADRKIGKATLSGKWSVSGDTLMLQFGVVGAPLKYKLVKAGENAYTAYLNGKKKKMTFTCK